MPQPITLPQLQALLPLSAHDLTTEQMAGYLATLVTLLQAMTSLLTQPAAQINALALDDFGRVLIAPVVDEVSFFPDAPFTGSVW